MNYKSGELSVVLNGKRYSSPNFHYSMVSIDKRRQHTDLSTKCELGQAGKGQNSITIRKKLMLHLGLTKEFIKGMHTCHLCACDSKNGGCQNVAHVYFGTVSENLNDTLFGHFNHSDAIAGALGTLDEPYCPDCGYVSSAETSKSKRMCVKRHIKKGNCNTHSRKKRQTHPSFAAKEKDNKGYI